MPKNSSRKKLACKMGHPFTPENTRIDTRGIQICKACLKLRKQKFKENSPEKYKASWKRQNKKVDPLKNREKVKKHKKLIRDFIRNLKKTLKCSRCPENFWACLDFHHRDPSHKEFRIGWAVDRTLSKSRILAEIDKCDVLCANCHRKEHFKEDSV